jgi:hypothetical protein
MSRYLIRFLRYVTIPNIISDGISFVIDDLSR